MDMYKTSTLIIPKKIPSGTVRFTFFISPPLLNGVSRPMKAKNKRSEAVPIVLIDGEETHAKFFVETKPAPTITNKTNGINFPNAANSINRTPCFTLRILSKAKPPNRKRKNIPLKTSFPKNGKKYFSVSASALATAASDITQDPSQYKLFAINPAYGPKAVSI